VPRRTTGLLAARSGELPYALAVPHRSRPVLALVVLAIALVAAACSAAAQFDPTGPCTADGSAPGAYPELEALVPATFEGRAPDTLDSGRNCTAENLGALADAGITEVRFAGGAWDFGGNRAAALVVFHAPGLTSDLVADFYAESATDANRTQITGESRPTLAGRSTWRLDSTTGDRIQTLVVWPGDEPDTVHVVITNDLPDPKIEAGVAAFGDS
jgi:hypothetical protein